MTNLYNQDDYRTADVAFSMHLGLMIRLWERDRVTIDDDARSVSDRAWRKYEDAAEALADADDTEDYQSVGVRLRESMLALIAEQATDPWVDSVADKPQLGNVKKWIEIFAGKMTTRRRQRAYLRAVWEKAWDVVVHLQHDSNALAWDAELALNTVNHALETFMYMKAHSGREDAKRTCPRCGSERFQSTSDWDDHGELESWSECSACGFATDPSRTGTHRDPDDG